MSEHDMTDSPQTTGGSLVGWAIGLLILLVGMVVAGFTLDAGQVWVVPETQSYTLLEKVEPVDLWVPQDSSKAKWLEFQGVPLMQTVLRTLDEHSLAVPGVDKSIAPSTRVMASHFEGVVVHEDWQEDGSPKFAEVVESGWKPTDTTSSWVTLTELPADSKVTHSLEGKWTGAYLELWPKVEQQDPDEAAERDSRLFHYEQGLLVWGEVEFRRASGIVEGDDLSGSWSGSDAQSEFELQIEPHRDEDVTATLIVRPAGAVMSWNRTIGVWLAAILTLCIMSFLIGDNPFYKTAEALVVGASAAYWMVYSFYTGIVDKLVINLFPGLVRNWTTPGLASDYEWHWIYIIPLILSIMLVCRLLPKGGWIARWPLAFIIGATAGFRLLAHLESDFLLQIKGTITSLWAVNSGDEFQLWTSVGAVVILLSVLACLVYFFFSMEHKGLVGKTARSGILVLMVTFGAAFGLTVMGRITLLTERFDFLFKDWLHLL